VLLAFALALWSPAMAADDRIAEATSLSREALALYQDHRYAEAEPLFKRALAIVEKTLGPSHPLVASMLINLAERYREQNRYMEVEPLYLRALEIQQDALGPGHPELGKSLNSLAAFYVAQGNYADAERLHKRVLAIREKAFGPDHPDIAASLNNLAGVYRKEGRNADAGPLYERALATFEKALGSDDPDIATILNNLAALYQDEGRYAEAEPLYTRSLVIIEKALGPGHPNVATCLNNLGALYRGEGRYAEAEPLYRRALAIRENAGGPDHPDVAYSLNNLAAFYQEQGRIPEAGALLTRALAILEKALGPDHADVANSLNNLAELYRGQGRYTEAEPLYKRALPIWERALGPDHPDIAQLLNNLAELYRGQGLYAEAEALHKRALAIREKALGPDHPDGANSLNNLAELYREEGRFAKAEPLHQRALAIWEKALGPDHLDVANGLNNLARLYLAEGQVDRALPISTRAVEIVTKHLSIGSAPRSGAAVNEQRQDRFYFTNYIAIADAVAGRAPEHRRKTVVETFRVAQMAQTSSAGTAVTALAARLAAGGGRRSEVIRERQDLVQQWQRLDGALVKAASRLPTDRRPAEEASLRAALADTTRRLDGLDARIAVEFPAYAELSNPRPLTIEGVRALIGRDEALLVYLATEKVTWLWVLVRDDFALCRIEIGAKSLAEEVKSLRSRLDPELNPDLFPFQASRAYALYQKIMGPAEPLLTGVRHLMIVADGALESLPMSVLVTKPPTQHLERPEDHRGIAWLARDYAVTVLPSVSSLGALRQFANAEHASAAFLGIGNPVLNGKPGHERGVVLASLFRGAIADVEEVRALPPLPDSADELRAISEKVGATEDDLLLGERASEPVLRQTPIERYKAVAFATHGLISGDLKGLAEPALVLTPPAEATADNDGLLTTSKIATLKFNADWVVLSACNTAAGDGTPDAGGLSGLAKAFFYAGARSLLVSHWPVWSKAAVALTTGAFAELANDPAIGRAEALRRSMVAMLAPANPPEFAHPLAWAPFVLAGEGGADR
jgi:CHAT domain-containing protein/Tfp pilus assembly protein PilF